eukprot:GHVT01014424.1.p1 GENE.GHVT01014424.1~~GHVT01014424.1.p1  ORF type:complete len:578 (+),score=16.63 GHVT01014424.1:6163-7896(+)
MRPMMNRSVSHLLLPRFARQHGFRFLIEVGQYSCFSSFLHPYPELNKLEEKQKTTNLTVHVSAIRKISPFRWFYSPEDRDKTTNSQIPLNKFLPCASSRDLQQNGGPDCRGQPSQTAGYFRDGSDENSRNDEVTSRINVVERLKRGAIVRKAEVESLDAEGNGVCKLYVANPRCQLTCSIPRALPQECVKIAVESVNFRQKVVLRPLETVRKSPEEVLPECKHFTQGCGGCSFQNLRYDRQLAEKQSRLDSLFGELFKDKCNFTAIVPSPELFRFRNKTEFTFSGGTRPFLGMHQHGRSDILPIDNCFIHSHKVQEVFNELRKEFLDKIAKGLITIFNGRLCQGLLRTISFRTSETSEGQHEMLLMIEGIDTREELSVLAAIAERIGAKFTEIKGIVFRRFTGAGQVRRPEDKRLLYGRGWIEHAVLHRTFRISGSVFFQTHRLLVRNLAEAVIGLCDATPTDVIWDVFCGSGLFGILLADSCKSVVCVDHSEESLVECRTNLALNCVSNAKTVHANLADRATLIELNQLIWQSATHDLLQNSDGLEKRFANFFVDGPLTERLELRRRYWFRGWLAA